MTHLIQLAMFTVLVAIGTLLGRQVWWLAGAYRFSLTLKDRSVHHVCDNPDDCPADLMVVEFKTSHRQLVRELAAMTGALVFALSAFVYGFVHLAQQ